jgi:hypothetical protein
MIELKYTINGLRFGYRLPRRHWRRFMARARILKENGIPFKLTRRRHALPSCNS